MTLSTPATGLTPQQWDDKFFTESFQTNRFASEYGTNENAIIQVKEDLTKKKGDTVTYALINRLTGAGVTGDSTLEGNEEDMVSRSQAVTVIQRRNAVATGKQSEQFSAFDMRQAARATLMDWSVVNTTDRIITELGSINGVAYGTATEGQKDAWLTDNADRVLFGALKSNTSAGDMSASLLNVDSTADKFSSAIASLMKRIAIAADPQVRPIRSTTSGRRWYIVYCDTLTFRDLQADDAMQNAQRSVSVRMQNEKLFKGGDLEWDGMIFKEIDGIASLGTVGASSDTVSPVYLCGAQAVAYAIAKRWHSKTDTRDYDNVHGVAMVEMGNFAKMIFGSGSADTDDLKDHGIVSGYMAAAADA